MKKYITFSVPKKTKKKTNKNGKEITKTTEVYRQRKLITKSCCFFADQIHKPKCKYEHDNHKCQTVKLNTKTVSAILNMPMLKMIY